MHVAVQTDVDFDREAAARRLIPMVTRLARRYAHSAKRPHLEDEYVSESLVALAHALDTYAPDAGTTLQTWAYDLTVQSLWKMQEKAARRDKLAHVAEYVEGRDTPLRDERREEWERDEDVATLLGGLDTADAHMMRLIFWRGKSVVSLAKEIGCGRSRLNDRKLAILAQMREQLS